MLITKIRIKFFTIGNKRSTTAVVRAKKGHQFTENGIQQMLEHFADRLEVRLPNEDFSCVKIGTASYNFVHIGKREPSHLDKPNVSVTLPVDVDVYELLDELA